MKPGVIGGVVRFSRLNIDVHLLQLGEEPILLLNLNSTKRMGKPMYLQVDLLVTCCSLWRREGAYSVCVCWR